MLMVGLTKSWCQQSRLDREAEHFLITGCKASVGWRRQPLLEIVPNRYIQGTGSGRLESMRGMRNAGGSDGMRRAPVELQWRRQHTGID